MNTAAHDFGTTNWFCLRTLARRERLAAENLRRRVSIEVFAPRLRRPRTTSSGFLSFVQEALFPGYLFARFAYPAQLRHVVTTHGVTGVVMFNDRPPPVADEVIELLRREVATEVTAQDSSPVLAAGAWIQIASGCFHHAEGRVVDFNPQTERVRVLLTLLGREVQVSVPARGVISASDPLARCLQPSPAPARD